MTYKFTYIEKLPERTGLDKSISKLIYTVPQADISLSELEEHLCNFLRGSGFSYLIGIEFITKDDE